MRFRHVLADGDLSIFWTRTLHALASRAAMVFGDDVPDPLACIEAMAITLAAKASERCELSHI
jgi:hypothetical protein